MKLRPRFQAALRHALAAEAAGGDALGHADEENVRGMVRLFLDVAEAYDQLLSTGQPEV